MTRVRGWLAAATLGLVLVALPGGAAADLPPASLSVAPSSAEPGESITVTGTLHLPVCQAPLGQIEIAVRDGPVLAHVETFDGLTTFRVDVTLPAKLPAGPAVVESRCLLLPEPGVTVALASAPLDVRDSEPSEPAPETTPPTDAPPADEPEVDPVTTPPTGATPRQVTTSPPTSSPPSTSPATTAPSTTTPPTTTTTTTEPTPDAEQAAPTAPRAAAPSTPAPSAPAPIPTEDVSAAPEAQRSFTNLARFENLGLEAERVGAGAAIVLAFALLVGFPATIFDATLRRNYDRIVRRLERALPAFSGARQFMARTPRLLPLGAFVAAAATAGVLLEDGIGWNRHTAITFAALTIALGVTAYISWLPAVVVADRKRVPGRFRSYPMALYLVFGGVLLSLAVEINPGYLYGLLFAYDVSGPWTEDDDGLTFWWGFALLLGMSVVGWLAWMPLHDAVDAGNSFALLEVADIALAVIVIAGIEGAVLGLLPFPFTAGSKVRRWSPRVWAALYVGAFVAFIEILLRPDLGYTESQDVSNFLISAIAFLAFAGGTIWFWWYCNYRRPAATRDPEPLAFEVVESTA